MNSESLFSVNDVISICAVIVALSALCTAIWQGVLTRRHNQLSVKPYLDISSHQVKGENIVIALNNHGVGPALISSIKFYHNDCEFLITNYTDYKGLFSSLGIALEDIAHSLRLLDEETAITQGKELILFNFPSSGSDNILHKQLYDSLNSLSIQIRYKCIYGNLFVFECQC